MGKASRNKRRRAGQAGNRWVATAAARDAQRRRDNTIKHLPGNPTVLRAIVRTKLDSITAEAAVAQHQGLSSEAALDRAQTSTYAGIGLKPPYRDTERLAGELLGLDADALRTADVFVISPQMLRTTVAAALTLTLADVTTLHGDEDLPCPTGLLVLTDPLIISTPSGPSDTRAISWTPAEFLSSTPLTPAPGLRVTDYMGTDGPLNTESWSTLRARAKLQGHSLPQLFPNGHVGVRVDGYGRTMSEEQRRAADRAHGAWTHSLTQEARSIYGDDTGAWADYDGGVIEDPTADFTTRFIFAFWRLCQQRTAAVSRYGDEPSPTNTASRIADTRIVRLRTADGSSYEPGSDSLTRYQHRWVVRMHKVHQWYPTENTHKIIWRGPYMKGPDGAPLLRRETVKALVR